MTSLSAVNLNRLVVFAAVVEAGSLTAAADRLGIAKTMVSTHMQRLEAEVGASLLIRTTRRVSVTEAGRAFYEASRQILNAAEEAISALAQESGALRGTLRVATPIDYGASVIAPMLVALRQQHPELKVELVSADRMVDLVAEGVDVAIRLGRLADSSHRAVKIGGFVKWLVASPAFVAAWGKPTTLEALAKLPFVGMSALAKPLVVSLESTRGAKRTCALQCGLSRRHRAYVPRGHTRRRRRGVPDGLLDWGGCRCGTAGALAAGRGHRRPRGFTRCSLRHVIRCRRCACLSMRSRLISAHDAVLPAKTTGIVDDSFIPPTGALPCRLRHAAR